MLLPPEDGRTDTQHNSPPVNKKCAETATGKKCTGKQLKKRSPLRQIKNEKPRTRAPSIRRLPQQKKRESMLRARAQECRGLCRHPPDHARAHLTASCKRFPHNGFTCFLTLFSKCFSSFPHGTCSLSVSCPYLALDAVYHPSLSCIPKQLDSKEMAPTTGHSSQMQATGLSPSPVPHSRETCCIPP